MNKQIITRINGVEILTVNKDGEVYIPIKPICQALGIEAAPQREKIQNDEFFNSVGTIIVSTGSDGKKYEMFCLRLRDVYGWLATINPGKVAPNAREAVTRYRRECYDILYEHFAGATRRQEEQNRMERELLDRKAAALESISLNKKAISDANAEVRKVDEQLSRLQNERLNPQPSLFD